MRTECNYCKNNGYCDECDDYGSKFIPLDNVKKYFSRGSIGINKYLYYFDTCNKSLIKTHSIMIGSIYYCPYCGERMYPIQDEKSLDTIGHCCICDGARSEIEYENKRKELENKYKKELSLLQDEYKNKLKFCTEKLFDVKQTLERNSFKFFTHNYHHFTTLNGKPVMDIKQIIR